MNEGAQHTDKNPDQTLTVITSFFPISQRILFSLQVKNNLKATMNING
jgi:hypothetical protein